MSMKEWINLNPKTWKLYESVKEDLKEPFKKIEEIEEYNSAKVMHAFWASKISEMHFNSTTGYGYDDIGRDAIENVYKEIFKTESALVRNQFISGSHALAKTLFGLLRPGDLLLSITGLPYDTLHEVIGIKENESSLKSFGIHYDQIELIADDFNYSKIAQYLEKNKVKLIALQRSRGYSTRKSLSIDKVAKVIKVIKEKSPDTIVMVDNCYCEFVSKLEPSEVGADVVVGSLIKNLGGGIASNGGYVVGKKKYVDLIAEALTLPGEGREVGPSLGANKSFLQGIFFAPSVVASALKTNYLASALLTKLGFTTDPHFDEDRVDIVLTMTFNNPEDLCSFCEGVQAGSPIDSFVKPIPVDMPGYDDQVIMAAGAFTQGSSIELSCDGPLREPYIAYLQGGLTYNTAKLGILKAVNKIIEKRENNE